MSDPVPGDPVWKNEPDDHDYPAAHSYLTLLASDKEITDIVTRLKAARLSTYKAKDILRASGLELLARDNAHVAKDLGKVSAGDKLSPVLLVRGDINTGVHAQIADGYHRVCASYHLDENADIPCHIVSIK
ncbi:MAG: hypothetical protein WCI74_03095 [Actinomycetes bacterium]